MRAPAARTDATRTPVATAGQRRDQLEVGALVRGIDDGQYLPAAGEPQDVQVEHVQPVPDVLRPRLVGILGQQVTAVTVGGRTTGGRVLRCQRRLGLRLEQRGVDLHVDIRPQRDHLTGQHHRVRMTQRPPGIMRSLVQPGRRLVDGQFGPQEVDELLTVQAAARHQGEDLHQRRGMPPPPLRRRHRRPGDHHLETTQQGDADVHGSMASRA